MQKTLSLQRQMPQMEAVITAWGSQCAVVTESPAFFIMCHLIESPLPPRGSILPTADGSVEPWRDAQ